MKVYEWYQLSIYLSSLNMNFNKLYIFCVKKLYKIQMHIYISSTNSSHHLSYLGRARPEFVEASRQGWGDGHLLP